jgi:hypothetical protein
MMDLENDLRATISNFNLGIRRYVKRGNYIRPTNSGMKRPLN